MSKEYVIMIPFLHYESAKREAEQMGFDYKIVCKNHPWYTKLKEFVNHAEEEQ